jgi:hypothetical protein
MTAPKHVLYVIGRLKIFISNSLIEIRPAAVLVAMLFQQLVNRMCSIDILYTLDSASNYSAIQKLKP